MPWGESTTTKAACRAARALLTVLGSIQIRERRSQAGLISGEEEAQVARFGTSSATGSKSFLIAKLLEWPGLHCAQPILTGEPLTGTWLDRTQEYAARRRRGENPNPLQYCQDRDGAPLSAPLLAAGSISLRKPIGSGWRAWARRSSRTPPLQGSGPASSPSVQRPSLRRTPQAAPSD